MRLANGIVIDKDATFGMLKFSALRREVHIQNEDGISLVVVPAIEPSKELKALFHTGTYPGDLTKESIKLSKITQVGGRRLMACIPKSIIFSKRCGLDC